MRSHITISIDTIVFVCSTYLYTRSCTNRTQTYVSQITEFYHTYEAEVPGYRLKKINRKRFLLYVVPWYLLYHGTFYLYFFGVMSYTASFYNLDLSTESFLYSYLHTSYVMCVFKNYHLHHHLHE